ncbi:MAG: transcriptional regulator, TetR family, partial [Marmoricola sp.]|nr:transcriptional regulator, TetR family [Marmoricola sp.]
MEQPRSSDHRTSLGGAVRGLRHDRGLTLRDLAARLGTSPATLSAVENGLTGVSSARLLRLAEVLDVPVEHLLRPPPSGEPPSRAPARQLRADLVTSAPLQVAPGPWPDTPARETVAAPVERPRRGVLAG